MLDDKTLFERKLDLIRMDLLEYHRGTSDSFHYDFALAIELEMEELKPSEYECFLNIAECKGYIESSFFESLTLEYSDDGELFWWSHG